MKRKRFSQEKRFLFHYLSRCPCRARMAAGTGREVSRRPPYQVFMSSVPVPIALVDDHVLVRKGLAGLISDFSDYQVCLEAGNGRQLMARINADEPPAVVLLDIHMPVMDGFATAAWLKTHHPTVKVLALSVDVNESSVIRMLHAGAKGYLLKDVHPRELRRALDELMQKGFFYTDQVQRVMVRQFNPPPDGTELPQLNDREREFLTLACSEMTYREIADRMCLAPRTIDGYREQLFGKLGVKNRVGMVLYAIRHGIYQLD